MIRMLLVSATVLAGVASQNRNAQAAVTAEQVRTSIDRAVAYLKREQNPSGQWTDSANYPGGITALCTLALLNAGVPPDDPSIQRALSYLRTLESRKTYPVALQTMVFCAAEPSKDLLLIRRNVEWLESVQIKSGDHAGSWSYPEGSGDNSNAQFAVMALHEAQRVFDAERVGVSVKQQTWELAEAHWRKCRNADGSWGYDRGQAGSGSMTCAGIASLIMCAGRLTPGDATVQGEQVTCCNGHEPDRDIEDGLRWLGGQRFTVHANPGAGGGRNWVLYYLYALERVGRMSNRRLIGGHDWYREGAEMLIQNQDKLSGFWRGVGFAEGEPLIGTSLALLFMAKGRRPVLILKAKFGADDDWNHHRSDLANLTGYVEKKWKRDLTWQVVDVAGATVDDLLQSPVLFISGSQPPDLTNEAKKLRDYVDRGGFIFAEATCPASGGFDAGFQKLMRAVFPEPEYGLNPLPLSHPVWYAEEQVPPKRRPVLLGIDYGCRTSVIYCPPPKGPDDPQESLSCLWELASGRSRNYAESVRSRIDAANSIGINVLAYATSREIKAKEESFLTPAEAAPSDAVDRNKLYVAKLLHPGGCDAAPGALNNLLSAVARELEIRVSTEKRKIPITDPNLIKYHLVFMHGRNSFRLTDAERKQLRTYLQRGGTLMADSICSNRDFSEAVRREMKAVFKTDSLEFEDIPVNHPLFTREFGGFDLSSVSRRELQSRLAGGQLSTVLRQGEPQLEGLKIGDRYAVIFSKYDLSCALEKHDSLECEGYTRDDAERIGLNIVLYSLHQ